MASSRHFPITRFSAFFAVSIKYVTILLPVPTITARGGTLASMAIAQRASRGRGLVVIALGVMGAENHCRRRQSGKKGAS